PRLSVRSTRSLLSAARSRSSTRIGEAHRRLRLARVHRPRAGVRQRGRGSLRRAGAHHQDRLERPEPLSRLPPPSPGLPPDAVLEKRLAELKKQKGKENSTLEDVKKPLGVAYREMLAEVNGTLTDLKKHFPDYAGHGYELAGFVWFQGWNDMINPDYTA